MTTRAAGRTGIASQSTSPSSTVVSQTIGGNDVDRMRPAKRARASPESPESPDPLQAMPDVVASSPLSSIAADTDIKDKIHDNSDTDSQGAGTVDDDILDGVEDQDLVFHEVEEDQEQSRLQSRAASESRQVSPAIGYSRQTSPDKDLISPTKVKARLARSARANNGILPDHLSPDLDDPGAILKRLPGRRRAHHPELDIEVDLRRQLELKVAYRAVAKALKPVLAELAERTARELEDDRALHGTYLEYQDITDELEERIKTRLTILSATLKQEEVRLERDYVARKLMVEERFAVSPH